VSRSCCIRSFSRSFSVFEGRAFLGRAWKGSRAACPSPPPPPRLADAAPEPGAPHLVVPLAPKTHEAFLSLHYPPPRRPGRLLNLPSHFLEKNQLLMCARIKPGKTSGHRTRGAAATASQAPTSPFAFFTRPVASALLPSLFRAHRQVHRKFVKWRISALAT
jgi:hypothetical protein